MGLFSKRELESIRETMRGADLKEFVDSFVPSDVKVYTAFFDLEAIESIHEEMQKIEIKSSAHFSKNLKKICNEKGYKRLQMDSYIAGFRRNAIHTHCEIRVPLLVQGCEFGLFRDGFAKHFHSDVMRDLDAYEILFFIYPAKRDRIIDDYGIPRKLREELAKNFYASLGSVEELRSVVANFARAHPFYRFYPFR